MAPISVFEPGAQEVLRKLYEHPELPLAVDTETVSLKLGARCLGVSIAAVIETAFGSEPLSYYIPIAHSVGTNVSRETLDMLLYVLAQPRLLIFANVQFDILAIETLGLALDDADFIDIQVMAHLIDENEPFQGKALDVLAAYYLHEPGKVEEFGQDERDFFEALQVELTMPGVRKPKLSLKWEKRNGWPNTYPEMMFEYARVDAVTTWRLWDLFRVNPAWKELPESVWVYKKEFVRVLLAMRRRGARIDQDLCHEFVARGDAEMQRVRDVLGLDPAKAVDQTELFLNRLGLPVVKKSKLTGKPSFDKFAMAKYDELLEGQDRPEAGLVRDFRGWQKAVSASYRPYLELVDPDGRLRCSYKLHGTTTGRLSCSEPNLQQIPKESDKAWNGQVKECFIPEEGYTLINADFSQLELRLATAYAGEEQLKQVFVEGRDIFTEMSKQLRMTRQDTKTLTYSMQYGAGVGRLMNVFGVSREEGEAIRANYFNTYPRFKNLSDICSNRALSAGKVRIWSGRYRRFQHPSSDSYKAMNSVIQGGAADIVERVMIRCFNELDSDDCRMLLQVHDSITWEVRNELVEEYIPRIKAVMEDVTGSVGADIFDVKFAVDVGFWSPREAARFQDWKELQAA